LFGNINPHNSQICPDFWRNATIAFQNLYQSKYQLNTELHYWKILSQPLWGNLSIPHKI